MEEQIHKRLLEIDQSLHEQLTEFPNFLKSELGDSSMFQNEDEGM